MVQLEELLAVRHSVFVVGSAGTGKSQVLRSLHKTYQIMKRRPMWTDLNPKAVTNDELFGIINPATREWKDGKRGLVLGVPAVLRVPCAGLDLSSRVNCRGENMGLICLGWEKKVKRIKGRKKPILAWRETIALQLLSPGRLPAVP